MFQIFGKKEDPIVVDIEVLRKQLEAVQIVSHALINQNSLDQTLQTIVKELAVKLDYINPVVILLDSTKKSYSVRKVNVPEIVVKMVESVVGKSIYDVRFNIEDDNGLSRVIKTGEIEIFHDFHELFKPYLNQSTGKIAQAALRISSVVAAPIKVESQPIGCLTVGSTKTDISAHELRVIATFADQISIAIFNAQQNEIRENQLQTVIKQNHDLQSLYNLTSRIGQTLEPTQVAQTAVDSLPQDRTMIGAILTNFNEKENKLEVSAVTENPISYEVKKLLGDFSKYNIDLNDPAVKTTLTVRVKDTGLPQYSDDLTEFLSPPIPKALVAPISKILQIKSAVVYPLIAKNKFIGTIAFLLKEKAYNELDENEKQLLSTYTYQISIALENANLYKHSKEIQESLEKALKDLQAARKHEQDMIDIMGHELRTPMSVVRNALNMMDMAIKTQGTIPVDKQKRYVDMGLESARREVNLIETLLSATKTDSKGFQLLLEKVDLVDVVNDSLIAFTRETEKKGIKLSLEKPEEDIFIYADRTRMQEISDNFISNALKYTEQGSITVKLSTDDKFGYMTVTDTGIGISEEDLQKLGTKFFRAKQYTQQEAEDDHIEIIRPGGTGLGLYVTFNLIKLMDGTLDVKSELGKGSTFTCGLPVYKEQPTMQVEKKVQRNENDQPF